MAIAAMADRILEMIRRSSVPSLSTTMERGTHEMRILSEILAAVGRLEAISAAQAAALERLETSAAVQTDLLKQILAWTDPPRVPTSLRVGIPRFINKTTGEVLMPGPYSVTRDHDLELDLIWADDQGPVAPLPGGTAITSDNVAVIASGDVSANDAKAVLRVAGDGTCNVTFANGALTVTEVVTVGEPVPSSLSTANPVAVAPGTPAG